MIDDIPQLDVNKRDDFAKHNSMRNFESKEGGRKASVPAASTPTVAQSMMNDSDWSSDGLSVMTEKRSNKRVEAATPPGTIVTPASAKNHAAALWK
jgi:hypothetical protein